MADSLPTASRPTPPISPAASLDFASGLPLQVGVVVIAALYFAREVLIPITLNDGTEFSEGAEGSVPEQPWADEVEIEFWDSIKLSANPLEYRVYLEQYPEGAFAPLALARLQSLESGGAIGAAPPVAGAVSPKMIELAYWDTVKDSGNPEMLQAYLDKYPGGEFS